MPTPADHFDKSLRMMMRFYTDPCTCANSAHPGKCFACNGAGITIAAQITQALDPPIKDSNCEQCEHTGVCPSCKGTLKNIPDEYSSIIVSSMAFGWGQIMNISRSTEKFSLFNVQWDLWNAWLTKYMRTAGTPTEEEIAKLAEAVTEAINEPAHDTAPIQLTGGGLSADEMRELGLDED